LEGDGMPILWRYLLKNYLQVFLLCVVSFIAVLLISRLYEIARLIALDTQVYKVLFFVLCQVPYILPVAIPISGLISAILLFQRLSMTHELTAMRASGISVRQISSPLIVVALFFSIVNFLVVAELTPRCRLISRDLVYHMTVVNPLFLMKKSKLLKLKDSYVDMCMTELGKEAKDIVFVVKNRSNGRLSLMTAKKFRVEDELLIGKDVVLISHINSEDELLFDHLVIENQSSMSTSSRALSELLQRTSWKMGLEHLPLRNLLGTIFSHGKVKPKTVKKAVCEMYRFFYFPLVTFTFTFMGISFGMQVGRGRHKKGMCMTIGLTAVTLLCYAAAKSFYLSPIKAAIFYFSPLPIILFLSLHFQKRLAGGIE
jgi:lipopolysaccharide export system permease protein